MRQDRPNRYFRLLNAAAVVSLLFVTPVLAEQPGCPKADALGVSRTVQIDTTGGPGFGMEHYKAYDFLQPKEVVLTFDDGPQKFSTEAVLAALAAECTKATFFSIGKMALGYPDIIREVIKAGHTVGTHTWSHQNLRKSKTMDDAKAEIERGVSGVARAVGQPISPFFRFPTLQDSEQTVSYLGTRNIAMFSTDIDSFDFKIQPPEGIVKTVMTKLEKRGKGIVLMHDIHKVTAKAVPLLLTELKAKGYKIVHLTAKVPVTTLPEFDASVEKDARGLPKPGAERATSNVVKTIEGTPPEAETQATTPVSPVGAPQAATTLTPIATPVPAQTTGAAVPAETVSPSSTVVTNVPANGAPVAERGEPVAAGPDGADTSKTITQKAGDMLNKLFGKSP